MHRKGENIYKRKDGRWEGRYIKSRSENGKAIYGYVYAYSYREMKQKLLSSLQETHSDTHSSADKTTTQNTILFGDLAELWMRTIKPQVKGSTYIKYANSLKNYILPKFNTTKISNLSYVSLEEYASQLLTTGGSQRKGLSPKTVSDIMSIIRAIIHFACRHGYDVKLVENSVAIKQITRTMDVLSRAEQIQLQTFLMSNINNRNLGLLLCLFTGIRVGEVCAVKWDDISLTERQIYIHRTMQRLQCEPGYASKTKVIITTPKSNCSIRKIPIPDSMIDLIATEFLNRNGYLLTGHDSKYVEPRTMQNHFKRVLKECQIRDLKFHVLRHTFATRCVELGFDIKSLSEILGHASVNITMNRYVHPTMDLKRENMNKLSDLFTVK